MKFGQNQVIKGMQLYDYQRFKPIQVLVGATLFRFESCRAHHFIFKGLCGLPLPVDSTSLSHERSG
jgi:hypothetical protein